MSIKANNSYKNYKRKAEAAVFEGNYGFAEEIYQAACTNLTNRREPLIDLGYFYLLQTEFQQGLKTNN